MDVLKIVREEAANTYTDPVQLEAFMEGFEKTAADLFGGGMLLRLAGNEMVQKAAVGLGAGLLGAALVKGVSSGSSAISNNMLKSKFEMALSQVTSSNKVVKGANPAKVRSYATTLFSFAPHVASDVNMLSTLLTNAVLGEGVDASIMKAVTDLEGRYKENNSTGPLLGIRT